MSGRAFFWLSIICVIVTFISVNALSSVLLRSTRLDLTENQLYTLSDGTREVLSSFDEPVDATFYFSRSLAQGYPAIRAYGARVREMLQSYSDLSDGLLRLEIVDPQPFSEEEDRAIAAAIQGVPTGDGEQLYMGLTVRNAVDQQVTIPLFSPEREAFLEYELTRALSELDAPAPPRVGVLSGLPLDGGATPFGGGQPPLFVYQQMQTAFDLVAIEDDFEELPDGLDILFIAHPPSLNEAQYFAIDQWMLANGRALILVDPLSRMSMDAGPFGMTSAGSGAASDLGPLLHAWGVDFATDEIVLDFGLSLRASLLEEGRRVEREYPAWIGSTPAQHNREDISTAALERGINFAAAGVFTPLPEGTATFTPLVRTSAQIAFVDAMVAEGDAPPQTLMNSMRGASGGRALIANLSGELQSAFPDGPPGDADAEGDGAGDEAAEGAEDAPATDDAEAGELDEPVEAASDADAPSSLTSGRAEIVLVADADILDDMFYVTSDGVFGASTVADNAAFIINVLDRLSGSDALISLRSRAPSARPMTLVDDMRARAEQELAERQAELQTELEAAQENLARLQAASREQGLLPGDPQIADEALAELDRARDAFSTARSRLRGVQRDFRVGIDRLEAWLIILNVWMAPILIALAGVWMFIARRRAQGRGRTQ